MSRFINTKFSEMIPYRLGAQPHDRMFIKLNSNESSFPPSSHVYESLNKAAEDSDMGHYSDQDSTILRTALASFYNVEPDMIFAGNGADEVLSFILQAYASGKDGVCFPDITYGFYKTHASAFGMSYREIPLTADFRIDPADYEHAGQMIIIANPNAPTGLCLTPKEIRHILDTNKEHIVVIDEAYVDFGCESVVPLTKEYDNLIVVHTMSKSRNIAALHVGYSISSKEIAEELNDLKNCFNPNNINQVTMDAAVAAVKDKRVLENSCAAKAHIRDLFITDLKKLDFEVLPSKTNFVFCRHEDYTGAFLEKFLYDNDILVRHYNSPRINDFIRISIGTCNEMQAVFDALSRLCVSIAS